MGNSIQELLYKVKRLGICLKWRVPYNTVMHKYFFILGRSPGLARAEIEAILPTLPGKYRISESSGDVLLLDLKIFGENGFHLKNLMKKLGGTIKIGKILDEVENDEQIFETINTERLLKKYLPQKEEKINFGFSLYSISNTFSKSFQKDLSRKGIEIKKDLRNLACKARFVSSRDKALSSVIVTENKILERGADICMIKNGEKTYIGKTIAVQDYKSFSKFDYGRPRADARSGMLPPKIARIMVNLAQTKPDEILLDPFCGSGTVLQEALLLGVKKVTGSDISRKAIDDSNKNLEWLSNEVELPESKYQVFHSDVRKLSKIIETKVNVIVTEPFLGPPLSGKETVERLKQNSQELSKLYIESFQVFKKILAENGRIVIIFPSFKKGSEKYPLPILEDIKKMGFQLRKSSENPRGGYLYSRPDQKLIREIFIFE